MLVSRRNLADCATSSFCSEKTMKLFGLLLSLCLVAVQSSSTKKMSDREHEGFIGPVKSVFKEFEMTQQNYGDPMIGKRCRGLTEIYDKSGRLIQRSVYPGSCGADEIRETYTYAPDGPHFQQRGTSRQE